MSLLFPAFEPAQTLLRQDGVWVSSRYGDLYFQGGAVAESEHHYIQSSRLRERFPETTRFSIGELGFGFGVNFLLSAALWHGRGWLDYFALEKHPLSRETLLQAWKNLNLPDSALREEFLSAYPDIRASGLYRVSLPSRKVRLTLLVMDAAFLEHTEPFVADAWYLDGFAPAQNPDMWTDAVFREVARRSTQGTTLSTFSSASAVQKLLAQHGFSVEKKEAFGNKREFLTGHFTGNSIKVTPPQKPQSIAIIGAGIAGISAAHALLERGHKVTVFESGEPFGEASGNPLCSLYISAPLALDAGDRLYQDAYQFALTHYPKFKGVHALPMVQKIPSEDRAHKLRSHLQSAKLDPNTIRLTDKETLTSFGFQDYDHPCVLYPRALAFDLSEFKSAYTQNIPILTHTPIEGIRKSEGLWHLQGDPEEAAYDSVILACASGARRLMGADWLEFREMQGQSLTLRPNPLKDYPRGAFALTRTALNFKPEKLTINSTFGFLEEGGESARALLSREISKDYPAHTLTPTEEAEDFVGTRMMPFDRLPMIGKAPGFEGLYLSLSHGAKGYCSAPYAAELIADLIEATPSLAFSEVWALLSPERRRSRFEKRQAKKNVQTDARP